MQTAYPPDSGFDLATRAAMPAPDEAQAEGKPEAEGNEGPGEQRLLQLAQAAQTQSVTFGRSNWHTKWQRNYKAFASEHFDQSKYKSDDWRSRSKIFRPKTRIAVTKDLASAAGSLFATVDAVSTSAGDDSDELQVANAAVMKQIINYRLDRTSGKNAIPWFLTSMGARQDAQVTGICVSKQYWDYQERSETKEEVTRAEDGAEQRSTVEKIVRLRDKPCIDLIPPECAGLDPAAHWTDPVNSGAYFFAKYPMHVQDVKAMANDPRVKWKDVTDEQIRGARAHEFDATSVRQSREGGTDRLNNATGTVSDFEVVWVYEFFIRTEESDWCFWTLGTKAMLSEPAKTEDAYPWKGGERPYRVGFGALEAHRIVPMAPVESWQQLQWEINDLANLTLDLLKQNVTPTAKVKRGKKIDTDALKRRYPVLYVETMEDVEWDRPPPIDASAFAQMNNLNVDFDDLAGGFNSGSVQSNRSLNETVGGMRLLAAAGNAVTEFQIRVWVETWCEPVLADLAKLEAYYEDDQKIIALAAKRAKLFQRFQINEITDDLLSQEVLVRVSAGVGSPDPMQKLAKFGQAASILVPILQSSRKFQSGEIRLKEEELINEVFGDAGIRDAYDRFFEEGQAEPPPGTEQPDPGLTPPELADREAERNSKMAIETLRAKKDIAKAVIGEMSEMQRQGRDLDFKQREASATMILEAIAKFAESNRPQPANARSQPR